MKLHTTAPDTVEVSGYDRSPSAPGAICKRPPRSKIRSFVGRHCGFTYAPNTVRLAGYANVSGQPGTGTSDIVAALYSRGQSSGTRVRSAGAISCDSVPGPRNAAVVSSGFHSLNAS